MTRYVIIGNSTAAIAAVEGIRAAEAEAGNAGFTPGEITIVTDEPQHTYSRPLISYFLLGKVTEEGMRYRGDDFYAAHNCRLIHQRATRIDPVQKQVILADGSSLSYDKLLVATGSAPFVPPFSGLETVTDKTTFMSLDDAKRLDKMLGVKKKVLIIGAGLIGLKCAEGILKRVQSVCVLDLAPRILSSILDEDGAAIVQGHLEGQGITFRLDATVEGFEGGRAILAGGETLDFDILVLAVGVRPNTQLLNGIAEIDKGIVVNEKSATSAPDIYAAGDCTQTQDISSGQSKIMALLPGAYMQGECAGVNMVASAMGGEQDEKVFDKAIPMNAIGFFGLHVITAGTYSGEVYKGGAKGDCQYKRLFYSDDRLNGYIIIGDVEKAGIYTSLIREQTPLSGLDFALVCEKPGLMAFTQEERARIMGNV